MTVERNVIQRPDVVDRLRRFLGMRQKTPVPSLATTLQPVIIVGDLDRPLNLPSTRRRAAGSAALVTAVGISPGVGITVPGGSNDARLMRLHLVRVFAFVAAAPGSTPVVIQDMYHPVGVTTQGFLVDQGRGGDTGSLLRTRSGMSTIADITAQGFSGPGGMFVSVPVNTWTEIPVDGYIITAHNPGGTTGNGQTMWFAGSAELFAYELRISAIWDEEESQAQGTF